MKKRHRLRESINESPKTNLLENNWRQGLRLNIERRHELTTLKGEERISGEEKTQVIALPHPFLNILERGLLSVEKRRTTHLKLPSVLVRQKVR